jgi:hypothetical protein
MSNGKIRLWVRGLIAAAISGGAGGISTGFASIGISPEHFNLQRPGAAHQGRVGSAVSAVIGVGGICKKSPLPPE